MNLSEIKSFIKDALPNGGASSTVTDALHDELVQGNHPALISFTNEIDSDGEYSIVLEGTDYWLNSFKSVSDCVEWCKEQKFPKIEVNHGSNND